MAKFTKPCKTPVPCRCLLCFPGISALAGGQFGTCRNEAYAEVLWNSAAGAICVSSAQGDSGWPLSPLCWQVLCHPCLLLLCSLCTNLCQGWWKEQLLPLRQDFSSIPISSAHWGDISKGSVQPKGPCGWALSSLFGPPEIDPIIIELFNVFRRIFFREHRGTSAPASIHRCGCRSRTPKEVWDVVPWA